MELTGQQLVKPAVIDMLKPWMEGGHVKSNECRVKMLQSRPLVDLYKCMGARCSFTTNESVMMVIHLYTHNLKHDSLVCAYCSYCETNNPESLVTHIEDVHAVGRYQCRFCFYRAFDAGNVVHHQYLHHKVCSNMKHTIITLYEDKTPPNIDYTSEAKSSSAKKRSYLECSVCHSTHVSISLFAAHVRTHGDSTTECPVCLTTVDMRLVQAHLINHRMDYFECLYCTAVYGYQQDMQHHLCNVHYLRAMVCCMKMKNCKTLYDIYITEKLSIDVPSERLIDCDTFLNRLSYDTEDGSESLNIISPSNEIKQIDLPKIVKVQGGIQMTKNLLKTSVLSVPEKVASIDTIGGSGCATAAQTVFKDGQIVKVQGGIQRTKNILKTAVLSVPKKVASIHIIEQSGCATAAQAVFTGEKMTTNIAHGAVSSVPKKVSSIDIEEGSGCVTTVKTVFSDEKIVKVHEGNEMKKNLLKAEVSNVPKKVASIGTLEISSCAIAAQTASTESMPSTSKAIFNSVRVKSFAFIKPTLPACEANQILPRKRVKLTKLGDGSIIMQLPPTSLLNGKIERKPSTVPGDSEKRVTTPLEGTSTVHSDKVQVENCIKPNSASRFNNPRFVKPTIDISKFQKNNQNANVANVEDEEDNNQIWRSEVHEDTGHNIHSASSKETQIESRNIRCYLSAYGSKIDHYYKSLEAFVSRRKFTGRDVFVCGTNDCIARFPKSDNLIAHMKDICQNGEVIRCKHCYMTGFSIDSYIIHLNIHRLEKFACFLCTHNHFLIRNVVEHMKDVHKCNVLRISFAHPQKVNLLQDVIVLIPAGLSDVNIEKHIDRVILEGTKNNLIKFSLPKQVNPRILYTCGFCQEILTSKLCLERHILLCTQKNNNYYPCAHCACRFTDWIDNLSTISRHLYFHGERLFKCSSCTYHHFQRSNVADHITQFCSKAGSTVGIVRESRLIWKCHICFYRSLFKQAIMEHMQNTHNLPGERYLCALCDSRLSTISEMKMHCQKQHYGVDNVSMVEMYHPLGKINEEIYGIRSKKVVGFDSVDNITIVKVNQFKADQQLKLLQKRNNVEKTKQNEVATGLLPVLEVISDDTLQRIDDANDNKLAITLLKSTLDLQDGEQQTFDGERSGVASVSKVQMNTAENCDKSLSQLQVARVDSQLNYSQQPGGHFKDSFPAVSFRPNKNLPFECNILEKPTLHRSAELSLQFSVDQLTHLSDNTLKPLTPCLSTSTGRRTSRRVAVKSNSYTRFHESFKYVCHFCKMSFDTFSELEIHSTTVNDGGSDKMCPWNENNRAFCLMALVRCFYCTELNTCEALRKHCSDRHSTKQFVCIDFWDSFKCGLCLYRNGSGSEKDFWLHFKNFHVKLCNKYTYYGYIDQLFLDWALNLGRNGQSSDSQPEVKAIRYICNYCNESDTSEVSIGSHVARHWLKFNCVRCQKVFKYLKHLYYHAIAIHRMDDLEIGLTFSNEYDKHLLDVLMVFENGLILSKRQVQHTTMATLEHLKSGFQSYYNEQVKSTDSYKETLLMPILASSESEVSTAETCKTFIQNQWLHLEIVLERVSNDDLEGKEK